MGIYKKFSKFATSTPRKISDKPIEKAAISSQKQKKNENTVQDTSKKKEEEKT